MESAFQIFIGFISSEAEEKDIMECLENESKEASSFELRGMERRMFTNYRIVETDDEELFSNLTQKRIEVKGQAIECSRFQGRQTYSEFIEKYEDQVVFLTGIPLTCDIGYIREKISEFLSLRDLFILRINKKVNKHFGFATFATSQDKQKALKMKKIKIKKFKITFKEFSGKSLEKQLFKKEKVDNKKHEKDGGKEASETTKKAVNASKEHQANQAGLKKPKSQVPRSHVGGTRSFVKRKGPMHPGFSNSNLQHSRQGVSLTKEIECSLRNPVNSEEILKSKTRDIRINHSIPGNVIYNKPPLPRNPHYLFSNGLYKPCRRDLDLGNPRSLFPRTPHLRDLHPDSDGTTASFSSAKSPPWYDNLGLLRPQIYDHRYLGSRIKDQPNLALSQRGNPVQETMGLRLGQGLKVFGKKQQSGQF